MCVCVYVCVYVCVCVCVCVHVCMCVRCASLHFEYAGVYINMLTPLPPRPLYLARYSQ